MLGSKFSNFHGSIFFSYLHSPHMFQDSLCIQLLSKHMLGLKFTNFHGSSFFSYLHSPHMFQDSLSIQLFGLHSPSTCSVQNFQIFTSDHFFMLTLSTHVSGFTLHTVIWFTLSKHMLGSKFSNFHERSFHAYTLHTCFRVHSPYSYLVYTLQAHVRLNIFEFSQEIIISCLHSPHMFHGSLSYSYLVYTLQAHVRFNIFGFSQDFIFFILTISTHVSEFTLHAVVFTLSKQMLHFKIL